MLAVNSRPFTKRELVAACVVSSDADCPNDSGGEEAVEEGGHCCCVRVSSLHSPECIAR